MAAARKEGTKMRGQAEIRARYELHRSGHGGIGRGVVRKRGMNRSTVQWRVVKSVRNKPLVRNIDRITVSALYKADPAEVEHGPKKPKREKLSTRRMPMH